MTVTFGYTL
jgi:U4/U6 small nuclear ribonucleoprotein PRP3